MDSYKCRNCGYTYQGNLRYCPNCGTKINYPEGTPVVNNKDGLYRFLEKHPDRIVVECSKCGYEIKGPLKYCPNCHSEINYGQCHIKPINNWQKAWGTEPTLSNDLFGLANAGCGCWIGVIGLIIVVLLFLSI